jgi:hypothetical protein
VLRLVESLLAKDESKLPAVPNLVYKKEGKVISTIPFYESNLKDLPLLSRTHFKTFRRVIKAHAR